MQKSPVIADTEINVSMNRHIIHGRPTAFDMSRPFTFVEVTV